MPESAVGKTHPTVLIEKNPKPVSPQKPIVEEKPVSPKKPMIEEKSIMKEIAEKKEEPVTKKVFDLNKPYEEMSVEELQSAILEKLAKNGPVTDQMRKDVAENIYPDSLLNWVKSFR